MRKSNAAVLFIPFCILLVLGVSVSEAQTFTVGVKGGLSIPNLTSGSTNNPLNSGYKSGLGPDAALFGEYHVSDLFSVELSLEYSAQGGKKNGKQALPVPASFAQFFPPGMAPQYLWANFDASAEFNYLLIPVLGKFGFDLGSSGAWRLYVDAGPFIGFLLSAKTITKGSSYLYIDEAQTQPLIIPPATTPSTIPFDATTDIKSQLYSTNYGVAGNIGIAYRFGPHQVFLEGGGNYGFQVLQKHPEDGQNHAGAAVVRIGYAYSFGGGGKAAPGTKEPTKF